MRAVIGLAAFVAATVGAGVYVIGADRSSMLHAQMQTERDPLDAASRRAETGEALSARPTPSLVGDRDLSATDDGSESIPGQLENIRTRRLAEDALRRRARESAEKEIRDSYSLLFEDLGLTSHQKGELFSFLVEHRIAGIWMYSRDGTKLEPERRKPDPDQRSNRIEAIVGYPKLQRFLALERNLASYWEVQRIESVFERNGVPVTETQRDGLFDILVATRRDSDETMHSDTERDSVESLEDVLAKLGEREHRIIELAPSVLSPEQVAYLDRRYEDCSQRRANHLDWLSRHNANNPGEKLPLSYPACVL